MEEEITKKEVLEAMHTRNNSKAAGLNSILHELWLSMVNRSDGPQTEEDTGFDIVEALTIVFNDIQKYDMELNTDFAKGWLCPLYKKGDKIDIGNY